MGLSEQVYSNLVHYNLWTEVTMHNHNDDSVVRDSISIDAIESRKIVAHCPQIITNKSVRAVFSVLSGLPPAKLDQLDPEGLREWIIARLMTPTTNSMDEIELYFVAISKFTDRPKRLTLALVNDDGTITYYFVHDGAIKPRRN